MDYSSLGSGRLKPNGTPMSKSEDIEYARLKDLLIKKAENVCKQLSLQQCAGFSQTLFTTQNAIQVARSELDNRLGLRDSRIAQAEQSYQMAIEAARLKKEKELQAIDSAINYFTTQIECAQAKQEKALKKKPIPLARAEFEFEEACKHWRSDFGPIPVSLPNYIKGDTHFEPIIKATPIPVMEVKGVGLVPMTNGEIQEEKSTAQLRAEAFREIEDRKRADEEYKEEERKRVEMERRSAQDAELRRQDERRQRELAGESFSIFHPQDNPQPAVDITHTKTKSGRKVIIKSPSTSVKSCDDDWNSEDERELQERLAKEKQVREERKRKEQAREEAAIEARRIELEAQGGDQKVSFSDFLINGSLREKLPPAVIPALKPAKRPVKKVGQRSAYSLPVYD